MITATLPTLQAAEAIGTMKPSLWLSHHAGDALVLKNAMHSFRVAYRALADSQTPVSGKAYVRRRQACDTLANCVSVLRKTGLSEDRRRGHINFLLLEKQLGCDFHNPKIATARLFDRLASCAGSLHSMSALPCSDEARKLLRRPLRFARAARETIRTSNG